MKNIEEKLQNKDFYKVIGSLIVLLLVLITTTSTTIIGAFFTYILAFLFGYFYYIVLIALAFLSLRIIIKKKLFPFKKYLSFHLGLIIVFIASLCFASFNLIANDPSFNFSKLSYTYNDLMTSFARHPNKIDSFRSLSSLGGGYIGAFLVALFGTIWKNVGDAIFFSLMLLIGIFLIVYKPLKYLINEYKENKKNKVTYVSPNQVDKKLSNNATTDLSLWDKDETINKNIDNASYVSNNFVQGDLKATSSFTPINQQISESNSISNDTSFNNNSISNTDTNMDDNFYSQSSLRATSSFTPIHNSSVDENRPFNNSLKQEHSNQMEVLDEKEETLSFESISNSNSTIFEEKSEPLSDETFNKIEHTKNTHDEVDDNPFINKKDLISPIDEEELSKVDDEMEEKNDFNSSTEKNVASLNTNNDELFNPLEEQAKRANKIINNTSITINMLDDEEDDEEQILSDEEKNQLIIDDYFKTKKEEENNIRRKKERQKQEELDAVLKYVSPTEKNYSYILPDDSLLEDIDDSDKIEENKTAAQEKSHIINQVFEDFNIKAKVQSLTIGSSVTRFNIQLDKGVKSNKLTDIITELQRALKGDKSVRIETVVEGQDMPGIEIGNAKQMGVSFKEVFVTIEQNTQDNLLIPIGKDISGNIVTYRLDKMPHLLVAGTTGSGKSVLIHSIIMTLLMRNYPSRLKLMLIDPKKVEFTKYEMEPHLFCPIICDANQAVIGLSKLCDEMERRYSILRQYQVVNMDEYRSIKINDPTANISDIPDIVCIIDEFADLMQTSNGAVAESVQRLTQKARAAGIYLIVATQRPEKNVLPGVIKSNIPCRLGLSCSSAIDSRVILDENGTETLLGKGDLLFKCTDKKNLIRAQSPFLSNEEIKRVLDYLKENAGAPNYSPDFLDLKPEVEEDENSSTNASETLYNNIKDFVTTTNICSTSVLVKNFGISYNKAKQIIYRLEREGII